MINYFNPNNTLKIINKIQKVCICAIYNCIVTWIS